jgi:hypothetical protein
MMKIRSDSWVRRKDNEEEEDGDDQDKTLETLVDDRD